MLRGAVSFSVRRGTLHPEVGRRRALAMHGGVGQPRLAELPVIGLSGRAECVDMRHMIALTRYSDAGSLVGCVPGVSGRGLKVRHLRSDRSEQRGVSVIENGGRIASPVGACASSGCPARREQGGN